MDAAYRAATMITANIAAHTVQGYTAQHMVAAAHERSIRNLCAEVAEIRGDDQEPPVGHIHEWMPLGKSSVLTEWLVEPPEDEGDSEWLSLQRVYINGRWSEADEALSLLAMDRWFDLITAARKKQQREQLDAHYSSQYMARVEAMA